MQLRCTYCQTMFGVSREETLAALEYMDENNLKYYDAHCPKCRRANRVERFKLEFSYPGWRQVIQEMAKQASTVEMVPSTPAAPVAPAGPPAAAVPPKKKKTHTRAAVSAVLPSKKAAPSKGKPKKIPPKAKKPAVRPMAKKTAATVLPKGKKPAAKPPVKGKPARSSPKGTKPGKGKKPAGTRKK